jgi:hypothetical protein
MGMEDTRDERISIGKDLRRGQSQSTTKDKNNNRRMERWEDGTTQGQLHEGTSVESRKDGRVGQHRGSTTIGTRL